MNSRWNWQEAVLGKIDRDYRESFLREDKKQARILIAIAAVWTLGYIYIEYLDLGASPPFYYLAALRFLFIGGSTWLFLKIPRMHNFAMFDHAILVWGVACVLVAFISNFSRDAITLKNINSGFAWMLGFYLVLPTRHLYKSIPALLVSIITIFILFNYESTAAHEMSTPDLFSRVGSMIGLNMVGFITALRLDSQRYHQYLIQKTLTDGRAQLKELATSDSLTGIYNRRSFLEAANTEFDRYQRYGEEFSFAILDLDMLKSINDTHGHPAGDHSIILLTETIKAEKRSSDTIGRLAGDEFGILLPNTSADKALEVLFRIKNTLADTIVESPSKQQFQVSFSAGVADVKKTDETFDALYRRADKALLVAKQAGRNCIQKA